MLKLFFAVLIIAASLPFDVASAESNPPIIYPCRMVSGLCYLTGAYNQLSNLSLAVDTGSSLSVLNAVLESDLKLQPDLCSNAEGPGGDASQKFCSYSGVTISIGKTRMENQSIVGLNFEYVARRLGYPTDGTIGSNLFNTYVVGIDYERGAISLFDPSSWKPEDGDKAIPIEMDDSQVPTVQATVTLPDGSQVTGKFLIDSGQIGAALLFSGPFQSAHPEIFKMHTLHPPKTSAVGGSVDSLIGRTSVLKLGPFSLNSVVTMLPINPSGVYSRPEIAGGIGAAILSRFKVVFDYPHKRIFLRPNLSYGEAFSYDQSGIQIEVEPPEFHRFIVSGVLPNSPASDAKIQKGDLILSVDRKAAKEITLSDLHYLLSHGHKRRILVLRNGQRYYKTLWLRKLL